jgi:hypothetical protein
MNKVDGPSVNKSCILSAHKDYSLKNFEKSHGLESHVPDWTEKLTFYLERIADSFSGSVNEKEPCKKSDYIV